jgi:hypothetical protein
MRHDETRPHAECNLEGLNRAVIPTASGENSAELKMGFGKIVPEPDRHQGMFNSGLNLILPRQGYAQSVVRIGRIGINL